MFGNNQKNVKGYSGVHLFISFEKYANQKLVFFPPPML